MIYFLHISKCAGSSFVDLAKRNIRLFRPNANGNPLNPITSKRFSFWHWNADEQRYLLASPSCDLIANESHLGRHAQFHDRITYVTILRDPIDRLFSYYQFNHSRPDAATPLEERGRAFARFLKREQTVDWRRNSLVTALTYPARKEKSVAARLDLAKQRLEQFDHVILMEELSQQVNVFAQYGWRSLDIGWRKAIGHSETAFSWSAARTALARHKRTLDALIAANEADLELYSFARELVRRRKSKTPPLNRTAMHRERSMPESENFDFLCYCAYDSFLSGKKQTCRELLTRAGKCPAAGVLDNGGNAGFVEFALARFAAPEAAEEERSARSQQRVRLLTETV
ncbi:MAG TPA: sulfotransferase family 2 domain-containing protein [Rhizomicrobium sp.]|jgi:hypothetical protein|nr:sulfotransferase family 2 domain-containing protein [Rhizomicrobium sp.]